MNTTIWKFPLQITDRLFVKMPDGAEILTVQMQNDEPCLWALVDPSEGKVDRLIEIFGTGNPIVEDMGVSRKYIATVQTHGGNLVWHFFERI